MISLTMITSPYIIYRWIISERQGDAANRLIKIHSKMLLFQFWPKNKTILKRHIALTISGK